MVQYKDPRLSELLGKRAKVLASGAVGDEPAMVATAERVAVRREGEWVAMGWHEIERGAWRGQTGRFRWSDIHGEEYEIELDDAGRLPELFRERVQASTVMTYHYDLEPGVVRIVVRRALDGTGALKFYAAPSGGARLEDPATVAFVVAETDRLKAEYGVD